MTSSAMLVARSAIRSRWREADRVWTARLIEAERVTFTMASTPFLADLTHTSALADHNVGTLKTFLTAGAPIPRALVQEAQERLGADILSCWGMTENGGVTVTRRDDPPQKVFETDGVPIAGMEVRVVGDDGAPLPPRDFDGQPRRLHSTDPTTASGVVDIGPFEYYPSSAPPNVTGVTRLDANPTNAANVRFKLDAAYDKPPAFCEWV